MSQKLEILRLQPATTGPDAVPMRWEVCTFHPAMPCSPWPKSANAALACLYGARKKNRLAWLPGVVILPPGLLFRLF
jgi:hypothetical protein